MSVDELIANLREIQDKGNGDWEVYLPDQGGLASIVEIFEDERCSRVELIS